MLCLAYRYIIHYSFQSMHKYIVNIGVNRSLIYIVNLLDKYSETVGACRGGNSSSNNAGSITYADRDCKSRCGISSGCSGYALPTDSTLETCETYTSFGSTGDGNDDYRCYVKEKGNTMSQNDISVHWITITLNLIHYHLHNCLHNS